MTVTSQDTKVYFTRLLATINRAKIVVKPVNDSHKWKNCKTINTL